MHTKFFTRVAVLALLYAAGLAALAHATAWAGGSSLRKPITSSEVYGACLTAGESGYDAAGCGLKQEYCPVLRDVTMAEHATQKECVRACYQADDALALYPDYYACKRSFREGRNWCIKFCRTNYP